MPSFPVDSAYLKAVRRRVSLARQLHSLEYKRNKTVRAEQWISKSAKAMDIEMDEDLYPKESAIYVHCLYLVLILKAGYLKKVALPFAGIRFA